MSAPAKSIAFPAACANSECGQTLSGPVKHCPFCGTMTPAIAAKAPTLSVVPVVAVVAVEESTAEPLTLDLAAVQEVAAPPPAPVAAPVKAAVVAPVVAEVPAKPKGGFKKVVLGLVALLVLGAGGLYQFGTRQTQQAFEQALLDGQNCLKAGDFNCALEKANVALQKDRSEPRAVSLLQRAQAGLDRQQQLADADKQAKQKASADAAARQAAAEAAQRDQAARDQAEQQAQAERNERQQQQAQQQAQLQQAQQAAREAAAASRQQPARQAQGSNTQGTLNKAYTAMSQGNVGAAVSLANSVLRSDPGNRDAQNILRQASQQQARQQGQNQNQGRGQGQQMRMPGGGGPIIE